jgi:hypothetical protein
MRLVFPLAFALVTACGSPPSSQSETTVQKEAGAKPAAAEYTKITSFTVDIENLNVDKIAMRDGGIRPDGNRDLVFRTTIDGPADALYIVSVSDKGVPQYGFRADTVAGHEELPRELGSVVDVGRLTVWIAVVEDGKFINAESGALGTLSAGTHQLKLYVPNTGNLTPGSRLCLYARTPSGALVKGPVAPY